MLPLAGEQHTQLLVHLDALDGSVERIDERALVLAGTKPRYMVDLTKDRGPIFGIPFRFQELVKRTVAIGLGSG